MGLFAVPMYDTSDRSINAMLRSCAVRVTWLPRHCTKPETRLNARCRDISGDCNYTYSYSDLKTKS